MSLVLSPRQTSSPDLLQSLPPSPDEQDLGGRAPWYHSDDELDAHGVSTTEQSQHSKGKAKLLANGATDESHWPDSARNTEAYPPTTEEEADTRRVQENLRRWEIAERQRWKTARDSSTMSSSVLTDVARRATWFWSRRSSHPPDDGGGKHRVLETSEDSPHLDDMVSSPLSAPQSLSNTPASDQPRTGPYTYDTTDPFSDPPPGSTSSLFVNAQPITLDIGTFAEHEESESATVSSQRRTKKKKSRTIDVPAPLDLPRPRSPPPRTASPHATRPPEPFPRPESSMSVHEDEDETPVPWWTEWLCGCSEGPDRGGESQAGRTNPLE